MCWSSENRVGGRGVRQPQVVGSKGGWPWPGWLPGKVPREGRQRVGEYSDEVTTGWVAGQGGCTCMKITARCLRCQHKQDTFQVSWNPAHFEQGSYAPLQGPQGLQTRTTATTTATYPSTLHLPLRPELPAACMPVEPQHLHRTVQLTHHCTAAHLQEVQQRDNREVGGQ